MNRWLSAILVAVVTVSSISPQLSVREVTASEEIYNGTYGAQLGNAGEDYGKIIYDTMVQEYVYQNGEKGNSTGKYTDLAQPVSDGGIVNVGLSGIEYNGSAKTKEQVLSNIEQWASQQKEVLSCAVREAFDAFAKDYPQVYWIRTMGMQADVQIVLTTEDEVVSGKAVIGTVTLLPGEYFTGASDYIAKFNEGVINVESTLVKRYGINKATETYKIARYLHDYLAEVLDYVSSSEQREIHTHTPMAVFVEDYNLGDRLVCEGYSKAFKILCDRFDVECALLIGKAVNISGGTESHMWNAVRTEDGKWYAVDVAWDDQKQKVYHNFLLAGMNSKGFFNLYKDGHAAENTFSNYDNSKKFAIPQIAENGFDMKDETLVIFDGQSENVTGGNDNGTVEKPTVQKPVTDSTTSSTNTGVKDDSSQNVVVDKKYYKWTVYGIKKATYTGKRIKQKVKIKCDGVVLKEGKDYKLSYKKNINAGKATMVIKPIGKYSGMKSLSTSFTINKASVNKASANRLGTYKYKKGKAIKPNVKLTFNGKTLKKGKDYTVKYQNNKKKGKALVIIKGKGNFKGTKKISFKIK